MRIWWLTAAGVTLSSIAAFLTLRWRAAASNARKALSGGRRLAMGELELVLLSRHKTIYQLLRCNKIPHVKSILESEVVDTAVNSVRSHTAVPARKQGVRVMSKEIENKIGSTIYNRINAVQMPQVERQRAVNALC